MFVDYRGSILGLLRWQWRAVLLYSVAAFVVVALDKYQQPVVHDFKISTLPLAVVGGAIGIFVSFRTNSAYDRWWEGRKLWGQLVNSSRHLATQALVYVARCGAQGPELAHGIIRRHIAYVHVLRTLLRGQAPLEDGDVQRFLTEDEHRELEGESNMTHALLQRQAETVTALADAGQLDERRLQSLDRTLATLLDVQGGCERIKKTPMPRGYGFIAERLIQAFGVLLPLGLVDELGWLTIPLSLLVCLAFTLINEVGRVLEDPFTLNWPALPLSALAKTIEINLRQRMGDSELPPMPMPNAQGILM